MSMAIDVWPLAPLAQGMVYETLRSARQGPYVEQTVMTLKAIEPSLLRRALDEALAGLPNLTIAVEHEDLDAPVAVVMTGVSLPWLEEDWRGLSSEAFADRLAGYLASDRSRGFELTRAPLMRALLVRETEVGWRLVLSHHHLLLDGWSAALLFDELAERYRALVSGTVPELPQRRPYRDFLAWLAAQDPAAAERYWRAVLADAPATGVPLGSAVEAGPRRMSEAEGLVAAPLWAEVQALGRSLGVTAASIAAAAWGIVLARATGEEDVVFGTTVSGRPEGLAGSEAMIGLFINTVPLRVRAASGARLGAYLAAVQQGLIEAREHGHVPLAKIQGWAGARRAAFETLLVYENYPAAQAAAGSALGVTAATSHEETNYPAALILEPEADGLRIRLHHDLARLGQGDAARLVARFVQLLAAMAAQGATARLCALDHRTPEDRAASAALARVRIDAGVPVPLLPDLFLAAAARHPAAPALHCGAQTMDYAALRSRALAVAHQLAARGARPGAIVAIALERGPMRYVALLAIWLCGAASAALDPEQPPARVQAAVAALSPDLVLVDPAAAGLFDPDRCVVLGVPSGAGDDAVLPRPAPDDLAYVILTSGSTGRPKPVGVSYRAIGHVAAPYQDGQGPTRIVAQSLNLQFDASFLEVVASILSGGCLALPVGDEDYTQLIERVGATHIASTPSLLALLAPAQGATLREVVVGGEVLPPALAALWAGRTVLLNSYGPTEATVHATQARVSPGGTITIGRPLPHVAAYVLNAALRPVAPGEPGELYLAGPGLARGYLGLPASTARSFLPDPFGPPGTRMYRTGDLVRIGPRGDLLFIGRRDGQVKIRGIRIELGEVEMALSAATGLGQGEIAATLVPGPDGRGRLIACVTRPIALERLDVPLAFLPQGVMQLPELPLTATGKVDRVRLKALAQSYRSSEGTAGDAILASGAEARIAEVFAKVLGLRAVGPDDDFLALGGDSIVSLQAASQLRQQGMPVSPSAILAMRTPRALAAELSDPSALPILLPLRDGPGQPVVLVCGAGGGPEAMLAVADGLGERRVLAFVPPEGVTTIAALADHLADAVGDACAAVIGHSFGAYVAAEAVRRLRARGASPSLVVLDATAPLPDRPRQATPDAAQALAALAAMAAEITGMPPPAADREAVAAALVTAGVARDREEAMVLIARSQEHGAENARHVAAPLPLPAMLLVRAGERADPPRPFEPPASPDPDWGWSRLTGGHVATAIARGNHISMLRGTAGVELGAMLRAYLDFESAMPLDQEEAIHA